MSFLPNLLSSLSIPKNLAGDFSLLFIFVGLSIALGFIFGRWKLVNILIDIYIAVALISILPTEILTFSPYARAAVFLVTLIFLSAIDNRLFDVHIASAGTDFGHLHPAILLEVSGDGEVLIFDGAFGGNRE